MKLLPPLLASSLAAVAACSAGGGPTSPSHVGPDAGTGGSGSVLPLTGGNQTITPLYPEGTRDPNDTREVEVREEECDDTGCTCLHLALIGTLDSEADDTDTQPFVDWLNEKSGGTAVVTMVNTKPNLDAAFLDQYDILVVANINSWTFSDAEKAAVADWVRIGGGGIVNLTGFTSASTEPAATSQLIEWANIRYNSITAADQSTSQNVPLYAPNDLTQETNRKPCLHRNGSDSVAIITEPIRFEPITTGLPNADKLTLGLTYVGAFMGWGIDAPPEATIVATDQVNGAAIAVAHEVDRAGRIFAFGDEWVIFANQWVAEGQPDDTNENEWNVCYQMPEGDDPGYFHSVETLYQTKQFWYNAINWAAPPNECGFVINDEDVVIR